MNAPRAPRTRLLAAATLALLLVTACAGGEPVRADPAAPVTTADAPHTVRFVLEVADDAAGPVWVEESDSEAQPGWVVVLVPDETERIWLENPCGVPDCGGPGGVCGQSLPRLRELTADGGERRIELVWDGIGSVYDDTQQCETRQAVPAGAYKARFCFGASTRSSEHGPGVYVDAPQCVDVPFELPGSGEVVYRVPAG